VGRNRRAYSRFPGVGATVTVEAAPDTTLPFSAGLIEALKRVIGMNCTFKAAVAALMLAVGFAGSVAAGPLEDALAAYVRGDYATALRLTRPLAEHGDAHAQFALGVQYASRAPLSGNGQGPQDYIIAHM
jgi:hypothetical protein